MWNRNPQTRFLARASLLLVVLLVVWWWVLLNPTLLLLRLSATVPLDVISGAESVSAGPSGDWNFRIGVHDSAPQPGALTYNSIEFTVPRADVIVFTFSVPVYWALALASWKRRRDARPFVLGTVAVAAVEVLSLVVFAEITAYSTLAELHQTNAGLARWLREAGNYLVTNVVPFAAPFLVAVALHHGNAAQAPAATGPGPKRERRNKASRVAGAG